MRDEGFGCLASILIICIVIAGTLLIVGFMTGMSHIEIPNQEDIFPL